MRSTTLYKAVFFDFDGTLTVPDTLNFPAMRKELGCPPDQPVLEFIQSLPHIFDRRKAMARLNAIEDDAAARSQPNTGAREMLHWLKSRRLALAIVTRNSRASVLRALKRFEGIRAADFDLILTRDDPHPPKPSGEGIRWAARTLCLRPEEILMVGDYIFDCQAGRDAGAVTVLLDPVEDPRLRAVACDHRIRRLVELKDIVQAIGADRCR